MQKIELCSLFKSIPLGREGYIYLIHAEGTSRYKIGRSVNPIVRHQKLQGQLPYPLKIIDSFWTLDMAADESQLHRQFSKYRAFGEWFDLDGRHNDWATEIDNVTMSFYFPPLMCNIADQASIFLNEALNLEDKDSAIAATIVSLYSQLTSREQVVTAENFIRNILPNLAPQLSMPPKVKVIDRVGVVNLANNNASERLEEVTYIALQTLTSILLGHG